jgi:hypothetical protein
MIERQGFSWKNALVSATCVIFGAQCVLAYQQESNFWSERRRATQRRPAVLVADSRVGHTPEVKSLAVQFPAPQSLSGSISSSVSRHIPQGLLESHAEVFSVLSPGLGRVRKLSLAAGSDTHSPLVIHIQDVHRNMEAQKNIRDLVSGLLGTGQIGLLALEGTAGKISLQSYVDFPYPDAVRLAADYLLKENEISGPIHAALTAKKTLPAILGIEDPTLYSANVQAYRDSAPRLDQLRSQMETFQSDLDMRKKNIYSSSLLIFDKAVTSYRNGQMGLGAYVQLLTANKETNAPSLKTFLHALASEKGIDFHQVEIERGQLVVALTDRLEQRATEALLADSLAYRAGQLGYGDFYSRLKNICRKAGVELSKYPAMDAYIQYVLLADGIDAEKLLAELNALEKAVYNDLSLSEEERDLVRQSRQAWLSHQLVGFSMTPADWAEYETIPLTDRNPHLKSFESFYREAHNRDDAMAQRLIAELKRHSGPSVSVLVTGGYHADGMAERLTRQGVTVVSFVPKIEKVDTNNGSSYLSVFSQEKTPLEKLFQGEKLFLAQSPWKASVRQAVAPALVVLGVGLLTYVSGFDFSAAYTSLGGDGILSDITLGEGTIVAALATTGGKFSVKVNATFDRFVSVAWQTVAEKRERWMARALSTRERRVGRALAEKADVVLLGGGDGMKGMAQAFKAIHTVKGQVKALSSNLSQSGRSAKLQSIVVRDWKNWESHLRVFLEKLPRWITRHFDLVVVRTVPSMEYPMQSLEGGISRAWLKALLSEEITDYSGDPSEWLDRLLVNVRKLPDYIDDAEQSEKIIEAIRTRLMALPASLQGLIRNDTIRIGSSSRSIITRPQPLRNLVFLGALYRDKVIRAPGLLRRSGLHRAVSGLAEDLQSSVVPLGTALETAWDAPMAAFDNGGKEVRGEEAISLGGRGEIGPIVRLQLLNNRRGAEGDNSPMGDPEALRALREAKQIVLGPANLTTLVGALAPAGILEGLAAAKVRGVTITWFINPVQNRDTEGLTLPQLVTVIEDSLSTSGRPISLRNIITDVVVNDTSLSPNEYDAFLTRQSSLPSETTDTENAWREAELVTGFWQDLTPEEIRVELEDRLNARVFVRPMAELTKDGRYTYPLHRLVTFFSLRHLYAENGRLVGVFDKDGTTNPANKVMQLSMARSIARALRAGFVFVPHTASSFEELIKHFRPLFLLLMYTPFSVPRLPASILIKQNRMIASMMDARIFEKVSGEYQQAMSSDMFSDAAKIMENEVRENGGSIERYLDFLKGQAGEFLDGVQGTWPGFESIIQAAEKIHPLAQADSLLERVREQLKKTEWASSLTSGLDAEHLSPHNTLALFLEFYCARIVANPSSVSDILTEMNLVLNEGAPESPPGYKTLLTHAVANSVTDQDSYQRIIEARKREFEWPQTIRDGLSRPSLPTREVIALWLEALLARERATPDVYGARVERRMKAKDEATAADLPRGLPGVLNNRRVQYVLRNIPKSARSEAEGRIRLALKKATIPLDAGAAGTSSINLTCRGVSKRNALFLVVRHFHLRVTRDVDSLKKVMRGLIFADDKPTIPEVTPAVDTVGLFVNAGKSILPPSLSNTVVHPPKAGPPGVKDFISDIAHILETVNPSVPVNFSQRPAAWAELMRQSVTGRYAENMRRGRGVFRQGGSRFSVRANILEDLLAEEDKLVGLFGRAAVLRAEGVRHVICAGVGGIGTLARMIDGWPSDPGSARLFPLEHTDPAEIERLKIQLMDAEATRREKTLMAAGFKETMEKVWKRAREKSALVVVAKGLREEGRDAIQSLTSLVSESFGQVGVDKPFKNVFLLADPPVGADDRSVPEMPWVLEMGAKFIPLPGRDLLKRDLHPGLPFAFLMALKMKEPSRVFEDAVKLNRKGEAGDGFLRLAAWVEGYVREGKNQMVLILPSDMKGMGPLTTRSVEPSFLSEDGNSLQVVYGLPVNPQAFPNTQDAHVVFVHIRRDGVPDENSEGVEALRQAGHPVARITLPSDPYLAFTVWMEGMFRFSSVLGVFEQKQAISTPQLPQYETALSHTRDGSIIPLSPSSFFEGIGLIETGALSRGTVKTSDVEKLLQSAGIENPSAADRYAALNYLMKSFKNGREIAEIRYFGAASSAMLKALENGQKILIFLLKNTVRLSPQIHTDYVGSLARPFSGTEVLLETLVWPAQTPPPDWETERDEVRDLLDGSFLRERQQATLRAFQESNIPHVLLTLPAGDAEAAAALQHFFEQVQKRYRQFEKSETKSPPGQASSERRKSTSPPSAHNRSLSMRERTVLAFYEYFERLLDSVGRRFGLPNLYPGIVPPGPTGSTPPPAGRDPMNFRHLPRVEILNVLRNDMGRNFPEGNEESSISVTWPAWVDSEVRERPFPVPELKVQGRDGCRTSYFMKPSNFLIPTQIGLEMQRRLGGGSVSVWGVPGWIVITDAGLDTITAHTLLTKLWDEAVRADDKGAQETIRLYMSQMNSEIGKLLGTEVILGYNDAHGKNVAVRGLRELAEIMKGTPGDDLQNAIQWMSQHPPQLQLFDFGALQFLSVFLREHYWEPGGVDYMLRYAEEAFGDLLRFSRDIGSLDESAVRKGFLDQMNNGLSLEEDLIDYLEEAVPRERTSLYFAPGFETSFRDRLLDDPDEWYKTLLADTVLFDYKPGFKHAGREVENALLALKSRLSDGPLRRTANVFDLDGDPRALMKAIRLAKANLIDEVIIHGDVFDRGSQNRECLAAMRTLKDLLGDGFVYLLGNHEIMMIESLILKKQKTLPVWLGNGGSEVLREFGSELLRLAEKTVLKADELESEADSDPHAKNGFSWRVFHRWVRHTLHNLAIFGNYRVVDYEYEMFLNDPKMKPVLDLAWWVLNNGRFHYVDDKLWPHVHAGLPFAPDKTPQFTALELAEAENRLTILLKHAQAPHQLDVRRRDAITALFHKYSGIFWIRKSFWIYRFFNPSKAERTTLPFEENPKLRVQAKTIARMTGRDPEMLYNQLQRKILKSEDQLFTLHFGPNAWEWMNSIMQWFFPGAQGIMIGHNRVSKLHNVDARFICADTGKPDLILSGPKGIQFVGENVDLEKGQEPKTLLTISEMISRVEYDLANLKNNTAHHRRRTDTDGGEVTPAGDRNPLSLAYLFTGDWRWGFVGLFVEWGVGLTWAHALTGALSPAVLGLLPAAGIAVGAMALSVYLFSFAHALVIARHFRRETGRAPPRSVFEMTHAFFGDFFPYLILPLPLIIIPAWSEIVAVFVLAGHLTRDLRSRMGRDVFSKFRSSSTGLDKAKSSAAESETIIDLMPPIGKGTFSVEDILGAIAEPGLNLETKAHNILQAVSPDQRAVLATFDGAQRSLLEALGINRGSVALVPLTPALLANPYLLQMAKNTLTLHREAGAVFFVESSVDAGLKEKFNNALISLNAKALLVQLEPDVRLFEGQELMMATLERASSSYGESVQPYIPPDYTPSERGVTDTTRFGINSVRPLDILLYFERLLELARYIAQQA